MIDPRLFSIATGSPEPIYRQLVEQVRRRVLAGQWAAGAGLPSVRELAQALAINPMTVSKAYSLLEAEGLLARQRGIGMVVAEAPGQPPPAAERLALVRPALARVAEQARELGLAPHEVLTLLSELMEDPDEPRP
ncbi:GntR family transcriptional regulator [Piscinibacter sakaiensis]|uniref:Transcriptional regulator, GntR family n=1 Tax=Piscinibacter sakaiensis TaxID=1547922 RepID=A0A0K8NYE7_PISS1|nr:GntR family transcriptional regulator [Piscinibacter sakaiensis]GAP35427.1 transcriptional regulator, GntR family [Piscinibacter sakaiensis]